MTFVVDKKSRDRWSKVVNRSVLYPGTQALSVLLLCRLQCISSAVNMHLSCLRETAATHQASCPTNHIRFRCRGTKADGISLYVSYQRRNSFSEASGRFPLWPRWPELHHTLSYRPCKPVTDNRYGGFRSTQCICWGQAHPDMNTVKIVVVLLQTKIVQHGRKGKWLLDRQSGSALIFSSSFYR